MLAGPLWDLCDLVAREIERENETEAERMPNMLSDEVQSSCENEHVCCPLSRCYPISFGMLAKVLRCS